MQNLINFFVSFDKLMKEKLVQVFFWLGLIVILMTFFADALDAIKLGPLAAVVEFLIFFVSLVLAVVSLRLLCEVAIAVFRINDNLSPDGGKSETAEIDPIREARKAAEDAAKRAREAADQVVSRSRSAMENSGKAANDSGSDDMAEERSAADAPKGKPAGANDGLQDSPSAAGVTSRKSPAKRKATDLNPDDYATDKDGNIIFNKDGSPRKKPGPRKKD